MSFTIQDAINEGISRLELEIVKLEGIIDEIEYRRRIPFLIHEALQLEHDDSETDIVYPPFKSIPPQPIEEIRQREIANQNIRRLIHLKNTLESDPGLLADIQEKWDELK